MSLYRYECVKCGVQDDRIGSVDDCTALCVLCGGVMLRLDKDVFKSDKKEKSHG